ncbi:hypothetical protein [Leptospira santarosai]|uniref:Uncharacterized protein n=1 Tax=Leptospira santarosai serovar Shermani str. LT 821 TaxID=758847 RepID=K8YER5_9LEPT|nr:hypothetical protein [Leptospira santarosai]EMM76818.1 hypothetical protein LEP1GSC040_0905 [Leptospira santarosai str. 2000030832]EKT88777.1 hypothetical protein LSS_00455 [Leptospira santarosai serovar Shermani str. LT 821]EPG82071.1 hypothetical protein LEP1GSC048_1678 [Leptospira santarosai serovar Shermani str. 1342KT]MDI7196771.1 hypothetical protein [Leptospira santarosai]MDI7199535.1 hypothetical protein [Leptospira santarosai]
MLKVKDLKYYKLNVSDNLFLKNSDQDLSSLHRLNVRIGSFVFSLLDSLRKSSRILTFWDKPYD